ncbi:MAG: AAA family ATPase, partial [Chloroflexota bacterium]
VNYTPSEARRKVYIIDEVHMLSKDASNALLKTLEEPPPHVIFVLATTEVHKVLPTILSRCQRFDFRRISQADVVGRLAHICREEGITVEPEALRLVARSATGSLRDAENLLEQLATYYGNQVGLAEVQNLLGITGDRRVRELVKQIVNNDLGAGIATITSLNGEGVDLSQFHRELMEYLRGLLLVKTGSGEALDWTSEDIAELKELASHTTLSQVVKVVKLFGQVEIDTGSCSTLPLELALVDSLLTESKKEAPAKSETGEVPKATPAPSVRPQPVKAEAVAPPAESKPPEKPAEPVPSVAATSELGSELERLTRNWKQVVEQAPEDTRRTMAVAILRSAGIRPVAIEGDTVVLGFKHDVHREKIEKPENLPACEKIISNFLGRSCRVRCIHEPESNHLVRAALKMGAQIIHVEEK